MGITVDGACATQWLTCHLDKRLLKVVIICIDVCLEYTLCPNIPFHHICVCSPREELADTTPPIFLSWVTGPVQAQALQANVSGDPETSNGWHKNEEM